MIRERRGRRWQKIKKFTEECSVKADEEYQSKAFVDSRKMSTVSKNVNDFTKKTSSKGSKPSDVKTGS